MICFPNAKINLGLNVISRRNDGYHNLETVFYPIGLKDALEIVPAEMDDESVPSAGYRFFQTGIDLGGNTSDNLVVKAMKLLLTDKKLPYIDIRLLKKIPFGAGLGGGSSDAAFMLKLLNETFSLGYSEEQLLCFAGRLGADCPFFIRNKPAFASGIGDRMEPVELNLDNYFFVLVKPDVSVSTREAYAMIIPQRPEISLKEIVKKNLCEWKKLMKNDFEAPVFKKYPEICTIKQRLYDLGAVYAAMSGSGSAVFGFFESEPELDGQFDNCFVWKKPALEECL